MLTRLALYATLGMVLDALGLDWTSTGFWCILALFVAQEHLTRHDTWTDIEQAAERMIAEHRKTKEQNNDSNNNKQ